MKIHAVAVKALFACGALAVSAPTFADDYPARPVTVVTPFPPGGAADVVLRLVTRELSKSLDGRFVVDYKAGAGGSIGTAYVARSAPDGYTLLLTSSSTMSINPHLVAKGSYDPFKSFTPIVLVGSQANEMVVPSASPYKSVADVIAAAKANPGKLNFGSNGIGTLSQLMGEMFKQTAGVNIVHVPYKGAAPVVADAAAGRVSVLFAAYASVLPMVQSNRLRPLATTGRKRSAFAASLPTVAESGVPGFAADQWWGLYGPAGMPAQVVAKLNDAVNKILANPESKKLFTLEGIDVAGGTPGDLTAYLRADYDKWGKVISAAGITAQ